MFSDLGNGSDGALNVTSGITYLDLDRVYNFTSINISSGATLKTNNTKGSVLYLKCQGTVTISGIIDLSNTLSPGSLNSAVLLNGKTFSCPNVNSGGIGVAYEGCTQAQPGDGFGGGGSGVSSTFNGINYLSGNGGKGSLDASAGGANISVSRTTDGISSDKRDGANGGGGSGACLVSLSSTTGGPPTISATAGAGGNAKGSNGADGDGYFSANGAGTTYYWFGTGGGGAGGVAGIAGINIQINAKDIIGNGTIIVKGSAGGNGGDGGGSKYWGGRTDGYGGGGGGGGGGNGADITLNYEDTNTSTFVTDVSGGAAGIGGLGGNPRKRAGNDGAVGSNGSVVTTKTNKTEPPATISGVSSLTGVQSLTFS